MNFSQCLWCAQAARVWNRFCLDPVRPIWDLESSFTARFQARLHLWPLNSERTQAILLERKTTSRSPSPCRSPRGQRALTTAGSRLKGKPATPSSSKSWVSKTRSCAELMSLKLTTFDCWSRWCFVLQVYKFTIVIIVLFILCYSFY